MFPLSILRLSSPLLDKPLNININHVTLWCIIRTHSRCRLAVEPRAKLARDSMASWHREWVRWMSSCCRFVLLYKKSTTNRSNGVRAIVSVIIAIVCSRRFRSRQCGRGFTLLYSISLAALLHRPVTLWQLSYRQDPIIPPGSQD